MKRMMRILLFSVVTRSLQSLVYSSSSTRPIDLDLESPYNKQRQKILNKLDPLVDCTRTRERHTERHRDRHMRENDGSAEEEENYVWLLGINVSLKPRWAQLIICGGGFFFGYMVNGICEVSL
jgi:hypothetical protein